MRGSVLVGGQESPLGGSFGLHHVAPLEIDGHQHRLKVGDHTFADRDHFRELTNRIRELPNVISTESFMYLELCKQLYNWGARL